jgi:hypothetical protein
MLINTPLCGDVVAVISPSALILRRSYLSPLLILLRFVGCTTQDDKG